MSRLPLVLPIVRASGAGRAALIVLSTGVTTGLLLVALSIARLDGASEEHLFDPVRDPGTRGGAIFAVALMTVPLLLLLNQSVRLGSSSRHRRYAALSVAGATRRDLRQWAALEVGAPAAVGSVLGIGVWWLLRASLGSDDLGRLGGMVPTATGPGWWGVLVVLLVAGYGVTVGLRSGAHAADLLQASRGVREPPRPWSALLLLVAFLGLLLMPRVVDGVDSQVVMIPMLVLTVAGLAGLAPWAAYRCAAWLQPRAKSAEMVLATRRLMADARPAGRAAAAVGAVALAGGVTGCLIASLQAPEYQYSLDQALIASLVLVVIALLLAVLTIAGTLAVHSAEMLLERRREMASLVAIGVPVLVITRSQRLESSIATMPMAVIGVLIGALGYGLLTLEMSFVGGLIVLCASATTLGAVALANRISVRLVRAWVRDAVQPHNLRTE